MIAFVLKIWVIEFALSDYVWFHQKNRINAEIKCSVTFQEKEVSAI